MTEIITSTPVSEIDLALAAVPQKGGRYKVTAAGEGATLYLLQGERDGDSARQRQLDCRGISLDEELEIPASANGFWRAVSDATLIRID